MPRTMLTRFATIMNQLLSLFGNGEHGFMSEGRDFRIGAISAVEVGSRGLNIRLHNSTFAVWRMSDTLAEAIVERFNYEAGNIVAKMFVA